VRSGASPRFAVAVWSGFAAVVLASSSQAAKPPVDEDGTVHVPAYTLPESSLLGAKTREVLREQRMQENKETRAPETCQAWDGADATQIPIIRKCEAQTYYQSSAYKHLRELYHVVMTPKEIGGVYTEVFEPSDGIAPKNQNRVLINLHGGGFQRNARTASHVESVPIASVGKIKIVSVDYRQAPEYTFPAASEDVAAVYRELLKRYKPQNIGIFGCSAGAMLTAEAIAWFQRVNLPTPGASGMFSGGASYYMEGDSAIVFGTSLLGLPSESALDNPYFKAANIEDPLVSPAVSKEVMRKFPPSLLIAGIRDGAMSSVVHTHTLLVSQGVEAELHIWEGLGHCFFGNPDLPDSREVYTVIVKFFETHLGSDRYRKTGASVR